MTTIIINTRQWPWTGVVPILVFLVLSMLPQVTRAVPKTRLTWVNGIGYSLKHMESGAIDISQKFGGKRVEFCHNPTAKAHDDDVMGYLTDLSQAGTQKLGYITQEVNLLVQHLRQAVQAVGQHGRVIHIAHSQGALVTALATQQLTSLEMSQMEVISFGGAAALQSTRQTPFARCINYYATNDPLLLLVPAATSALKSGFVGSEEFCFLMPREGDPILDHGLHGKTYGQALIWEGHRFQQMYVGRLERTLQMGLTILVTGSQLMQSQLVALLKLLLRPLVLLWMLLRRLFWDPVWTLFKSRILPPILLAGLALFEAIYVTIRKLTGDEDYLPADTLIHQHQQQQQQQANKRQKQQYNHSSKHTT